MTFNVAISEKVEQSLLSRTVLKGIVAYDTAPPSFAELRKHIAESLKVDERLVVVKSTLPVFGARQSALEAHIYKSKEAAGLFASKVVVARNSPRLKKAAAAMAATAAAAEKK